MKQNILLVILISLAVALAGIGVWVYVSQIAPKPALIIQPVALERPDAERQNQIDDEAAIGQKHISYDMFGTSEFSTIVEGYYQKKEDAIGGIGNDGEEIVYSNPYFVITKFEDVEFEENMKQAIDRGNLHNRFEDNHYKFNLGFFKDKKIECDNYKNPGLSCLDEVVELKIKNSTLQNQIRIKLFFGEHYNNVGSLAYKIELVD